jgi:hypothetical protein
MNRIIIKKITREPFSPYKPVKVTILILNPKGEQMMDIVLSANLFPEDIKEENEVKFSLLS